MRFIISFFFVEYCLIEYNYFKMNFIFVLIALACAQSRFEEKTINSKKLKEDVKYNVYFPNVYSDKTKYPIM